MSDTPQGPDWWQASNDKWYPPPRPDMPGDQTTIQAEGAPPWAPTGPPEAPPSVPPGPAPGAWGAPSPSPDGFVVPPGAPGPYDAPAGPPMDPYGAGPGMAQDPYAMQGPIQQSNRMPLFIVLGVVGLGALFLVLYLVLGGDDDTEPTADSDDTTNGTLAPEDDPEEALDDEEDPGPPAEGSGWDGNPTTGGSTESTELSDGLTLLEYGFSNVTYVYNPEEFRSSWGLIVENTGSETAENFLINVTLYDAEGGVIDSVDETIYILAAGEEMGIGETLLSYEHGTPIADMEIQYGGKEDFAEDRGISGSFTTSNIQTEQANEYSLSTTFTVESSYDTPAENPSAYVILRNTSGEIIGGDQGYELSYVGAGSTSDTKIDTLARFDEVDIAMDQTEAYVDYGY